MRSTLDAPTATPEGDVLAFVGMGANLGDAHAALRGAGDELAAAQGVSSCRLGPLYSSAPVDATGPDYVNTVARITTSLAPLALLDLLQAIEQRHGRERPFPNAPRTLDLDLLLYGDAQINEPRLTVPHPRMHQRAFVLLPLADLEPDLKLAQGSVRELSRALDQRISRIP